MQQILLLGGTGLLGSEFKDIFNTENIPFLAPTRAELNLVEEISITQFFEKNDPKNFSKIVFCAAYTNVDKAETEQELCKKLNVQSLEKIITYKIPLIHFSSDYVFDAPEGIEIPEEHPRKALNFYGQTKLWAEEALEKSNTDWWNIRTTWLFGKYGKNFISTIIQKSQQNESLNIVDDEIGRPTSAKDLATFITENFIKDSQPSGHYHLQNQGEPISWARLTEFILQKPVSKIKSSDLNRPAKRPRNSVLKNTKLNENLRDWNNSVQEFLN